MRYDGETYSPEFDETRLNAQTLRVYRLIKDGEWRTLGEISKQTGDPMTSVSARLRDLRKERFGGFIVERRPRGARCDGLFEYALKVPEPAAMSQGGLFE